MSTGNARLDPGTDDHRGEGEVLGRHLTDRRGHVGHDAGDHEAVSSDSNVMPRCCSSPSASGRVRRRCARGRRQSPRVLGFGAAEHAEDDLGVADVGGEQHGWIPLPSRGDLNDGPSWPTGACADNCLTPVGSKRLSIRRADGSRPRSGPELGDRPRCARPVRNVASSTTAACSRDEPAGWRRPPGPSRPPGPGVWLAPTASSAASPSARNKQLA